MIIITLLFSCSVLWLAAVSTHWKENYNLWVLSSTSENVDINFAQEVYSSYLFVVMALNVVAHRLWEVQVDPAHLLQE